MLSYLTPTLLLLFSVSLFSLGGLNHVSAETETSGSELTENTESKLKIGLGGGIQFGGLFGGQFGYVVNDHKTYASVGVSGLGVGYNYALSNDFSIGVNISFFVPGVALAAGSTVNLNYHFENVFQKGWMVGIDAGRIARVGGFADNSSNNIVFISGGYIF